MSPLWLTCVISELLVSQTAARLVRQWALVRQDELRSNWERARAKLPLERIAGLDAD
jgi:hypothetical protein